MWGLIWVKIYLGQINTPAKSSGFSSLNTFFIQTSNKLSADSSVILKYIC